jgi:hypothetical protein
MVDRRTALTRLIAMVGGTGLGSMIAAFLDAAGPLAPIGAQAIYALEPLLRTDGSDWVDIGGMLEDPRRLEQFIADLRGGGGERS